VSIVSTLAVWHPPQLLVRVQRRTWRLQAGTAGSVTASTVGLVVHARDPRLLARGIVHRSVRSRRARGAAQGILVPLLQGDWERLKSGERRADEVVVNATSTKET
jgi:hypothetical protein